MGYFSSIGLKDLAGTAASSFFASQGINTGGVLTPAGSATADAKAAVANPPRNGVPVQAKSDDPGTRKTTSKASQALHLGNPYVLGGIVLVLAIGAYFALKK